MRSNFIENIVYKTIGLIQKNENDWLWNSKLKSITLVPYEEKKNKNFIMRFFEWIFMAFFDSFLEIWWIILMIMDKEWYLDKNILIRKRKKKMKCEKKFWWAIISIYDILDYNKEFLFVFSFH